jgi:hypothetical protein
LLLGDYANCQADTQVLQAVVDSGGKRIVFSDHGNSFSGGSNGARVLVVLTDTALLVLSERSKSLMQTMRIKDLSSIALSPLSAEIATFNGLQGGYTLTMARRVELQDHLKTLFLNATRRVLAINGP